MSSLTSRSNMVKRPPPRAIPRRKNAAQINAETWNTLQESFDQGDMETTLGPDLTWWKNGDTVSGVGPDDGWTLDGKLAVYGGTTPGAFVAQSFPGQYGVSADGGGSNTPVPANYSTRVLLGGAGGAGGNAIIGPIDPTTGLPEARQGYVLAQPTTPVGADDMFTQAVISAVPDDANTTPKNNHVDCGYVVFCRCNDFSAAAPGAFGGLYLSVNRANNPSTSVGPFTYVWTASIGYNFNNGVDSATISQPSPGAVMRVQLVGSVLTGLIDGVVVCSYDLSTLRAPTWAAIQAYDTFAAVNIQYVPDTFNFGSPTNGGPWPGWPSGNAFGFSGVPTGGMSIDDFLASRAFA